MRTALALAAAVAVLGFSVPAAANSGEDLIKANKCSRCHTATTTKKGPSFADLAAKYKADAGAATKFFDMLKKGNDDHKPVKASDAELKSMVDVVMSAK